MSEHSDLLVVGGGLMGSGVAYEAARRGYRVRILTKALRGVAHEVAAGMLAPISEAEPVLGALTQWGLKSLEQYPAFVEALEDYTKMSCGFRTEGAIHVAVSRDHLSQLSHISDTQERMGLRVERLDSDEIRALEPRLTPRAIGGLLLPDEAHIDPQALFQCLTAAHQRLGVDTTVIDQFVDWAGGADRVEGAVVIRQGEKVRYRAEATVVTVGAWSHSLPGLSLLPMRPVKGQVILVKGEPLVSRTIRTPDVYVVPRSSGRLWIGASCEEVGFDPEPRAGEVMELLWEARRVLPGVSELIFERALAGFRPTLRDHLPAVGPTDRPGLWLSTGHYRNGVLLLPATIHGLLQAIDTGGLPDELQAFSPLRFVSCTLQTAQSMRITSPRSAKSIQ